MVVSGTNNLGYIFVLSSFKIVSQSSVCSKQTSDGSVTSFDCVTNCCGSLTERVCCPDMSDPANRVEKKLLSQDLVIVVVTVVVLFAIAVIVFTVIMWWRQNTTFCKPSTPPTSQQPQTAPAPPRSTRRNDYDTGISKGLGGQSAFPTRLHPSLFRGLRSEDGASMDPGFFSSDYGSDRGMSIHGRGITTDFA